VSGSSRFTRQLVTCAALAAGLVACGSGPSKSQALETIQARAKEDGNCTLPVSILTQLKMQHMSKGVCVPKEGAAKARACVDALIAANVTRRMPDAYMLAWPDEVSGASLSDVPAYDRRSRDLMYSICVEQVGGLREGRFACADVRAQKVLKVTTTDETHAEVRYERAITVEPTLAAIDAACGATTRPPAEATVTFLKSTSGWAIAPAVDEAPR
jgi:hypothetical protein